MFLSSLLHLAHGNYRTDHSQAEREIKKERKNFCLVSGMMIRRSKTKSFWLFLQLWHFHVSFFLYIFIEVSPVACLGVGVEHYSNHQFKHLNCWMLFPCKATQTHVRSVVLAAQCCRAIPWLVVAVNVELARNIFYPNIFLPFHSSAPLSCPIAHTHHTARWDRNGTNNSSHNSQTGAHSKKAKQNKTKYSQIKGKKRPLENVFGHKKK